MMPTRVVVADDSAFMRKLISDVLERDGMEVAGVEVIVRLRRKSA